MPSLRDPFFFQGLHAQLLRHEKEFEDGQHFPPQNEQPTSSILSRFVANLGNRSAFEFSTYCVYIYIHIIYCSHTYRFSIQLQTLYFFSYRETHHFVLVASPSSITSLEGLTDDRVMSFPPCRVVLVEELLLAGAGPRSSFGRDAQGRARVAWRNCRLRDLEEGITTKEPCHL